MNGCPRYYFNEGDTNVNDMIKLQYHKAKSKTDILFP